MSGIVGLVHLDGEPVDRALLARMTESLTFRGPDAQDLWLEGSVGFGHTMLRTTWEAEFEHQPFTLDQQVWIIADARIDDRAVLAEKLGLPPLPSPPFQPNCTDIVTDVELILRAYLKWGDACVDHLLGDFAFGIWDGRNQRLFCARDQIGVKLFYYSQVGKTLIFSNTLNCIRLHPQVSRQLNEAAIGDFLVAWQNCNPATTSFADIQKLPGGHTLTWSPNTEVQVQKYWTLPLPELIRYQNPQDYIDQFQHLMGQAVHDRLRQEKIAIYFSGGLDSTTIAATALEVARQKSQSLDLQAFTTVYDRIIPDQERYYANLAAKALSIPINFTVGDDYPLFDGWDQGRVQLPEPIYWPLLSMDLDQNEAVAKHSRVVLYGDGGDEVLTGANVVDLLACMSPTELLGDIINSLVNHRLSPHWGTGWLRTLRNLGRGKASNGNDYPKWLNPDFAARCQLMDRWQEYQSKPPKPLTPRGVAHYKFTSPLYQALFSAAFEHFDVTYLKIPIELRFPFFDLRLMNYLLALPPIPWCVSKRLLRMAMHKTLPKEVCQRPKTPLVGSPETCKLAEGNWHWQDAKDSPTILREFVDLDVLQQIDPLTGRAYWSSDLGLRVVSLAYWLNFFF